MCSSSEFSEVYQNTSLTEQSDWLLLGEELVVSLAYLEPSQTCEMEFF